MMASSLASPRAWGETFGRRRTSLSKFFGFSTGWESKGVRLSSADGLAAVDFVRFRCSVSAADF
jgi:hypothetical protein